MLVLNASRNLCRPPHCLSLTPLCWRELNGSKPTLDRRSTLSGFQICWSSPPTPLPLIQPSFLLLSAPYCAGPMGKLTLWRATSAIPNERRIYMIFLPPALGFVLPRKQPTKNVVTFQQHQNGNIFQKHLVFSGD